MKKTYVYRARDSQGNVINGTLAADSEAQVLAYLHEQNYYINFLQEENDTVQRMRNFPLFKPIKSQEIVVFCRQLSVMVNCGLPLLHAMKILLTQTNHPVFKKVLSDIYRSLEQGITLTEAMRRHSHVFSALMLHMIEVGEAGGVLDEVLERLAVHLEKDEKIKEKVKTAMIYPLFVLGISVVMVTVIMLFVMPVFVRIFDSINMTLPLPTKMLLSFSLFLQDFYWIIAAVLGGAIIGGIKIFSLPKYRSVVDQYVLKIPLLGALMLKVATARFTRTLGVLLKGGIPLITALATSKNVIGNRFLIRSMQYVEKNVKDGFALSAILARQKIFPPMVIQMIAVGEETGKLDVLLGKIADFYENDVENMTARLSSLLEPMIILVLGVIVGGIVLAVALPMFDSVMYSIG